MRELLSNEIILIFILLLVLFIIFPGYGLLAQRRRSRNTSARILTENALKHIFDCEYKNLTATLKSLAGSLSLSVNRAADIVRKLQSMNLVNTSGEAVKLTQNGRNYALHVIRTHRLWERFLADETSKKETEWHAEAEIKEHFLSDEEIKILAAQLGQPMFDPHGDPIPTESGELPEPIGFPLNELKPGDSAEIIHIEDEPQNIYAEIVSAGLKVGHFIKAISMQPDKITIASGGEGLTLNTLMASNITVKSVTGEETALPGSGKTLASLKIGETGLVIGISRHCRGRQRKRLMDLGVLPGTSVKAELKSPAGDLTAYIIRGASIALRKKQAEDVLIEDNITKENGA